MVEASCDGVMSCTTVCQRRARIWPEYHVRRAHRRVRCQKIQCSVDTGPLLGLINRSWYVINTTTIIGVVINTTTIIGVVINTTTFLFF